MNRNQFFSGAIILIACSVLWAINPVPDRSSAPSLLSLHPQPTGDAQTLTGAQHRDLAGERKQFKEQRREYLESLHRAAPDTDWRAMNRENRRLLAEERFNQQNGLAKANQTVAGTWTEKGSNNLSGRMHVTTVHNDVIYAGSSGGIVWRGQPDGTGWTPLNDWLRMPNIVAVEVIPDGVGGHRILVYNAGTDFIHYSDDDGGTWNTAPGLESPVSWGSPRRADVLGDPGRTVYLLAQEWDYDEWHEAMGFYRSIDRGTSFERLQLLDESPAHMDLWCPDNHRGPGYLVRQNSVYAIGDDGELTLFSTIPATHAPAEVRRTQLRGRVNNGDADLYVAYALNDGTTSIYRALTGSAAFAYSGSVPQTAFRENSFEVSTATAGELYLGGVDAYRSANYGTTWSLVNNWWEYYEFPATRLHADIPGINAVQIGGQEKTLISTDGGVYLSDDGLASVQNISLSGMRISQYYDVYTHQSTQGVVFAGSQDQGFQRSLGDGGGLMDFQQTISGDYAHLVSSDGGASIWCVYPSFAMRYPDAANTLAFRTWDFTVGGQFWLPPLMADPDNPAICWLGGGTSTVGAHLLRLTDNGSNVAMTEMPYDFTLGAGGRISALAYSPVETNRRYVMTDDGNVHLSTDSGAQWTVSPAFTGPSGHYFHGASVVASPLDAQTVWIGGSGYSNPPVYVSQDGGTSFIPLDVGLPSTLVYMLAVSNDAELLFAATELGPYVCDLQTGVWENIAGVSAPDQVYWCVEWVESLNAARFGTYGRGIWDFAVGTVADVPQEMPRRGDFALQASPNPFNPRSNITFVLPSDGLVQLDLYDVRGARVAEVFRGHLNAGTHEKSLDGQRLSSGVYLLRIESAGRHEEMRVTLLK